MAVPRLQKWAYLTVYGQLQIQLWINRNKKQTLCRLKVIGNSRGVATGRPAAVALQTQLSHDFDDRDREELVL